VSQRRRPHRRRRPGVGRRHGEFLLLTRVWAISMYDGVFFQQDDAAERLARGLVSAVHHVVTHHECSPTRPLGVLFSGGVDSTALLAVARRMNVPVVAATAGWIGTKFISTRVRAICMTSCFLFNSYRYRHGAAGHIPGSRRRTQTGRHVRARGGSRYTRGHRRAA